MRLCFLRRIAPVLAAAAWLTPSGTAAHAQNTFITTNTLITTDVPGDLFIGVDAVPPGQTINANVASEILGINVGNDVLIYNASTFDFAGGDVSGGLRIHDHSAVRVSAGTIESGSTVFDDSTLTISGGSVNSPEALGTGTINIKGGSVDGLIFAVQNSVVNISGGTISANMELFDQGVLNLFGPDLTSVLTHPNNDAGFRVYTLSGHLLDGSDITGRTISVLNGSNATFTLTNPSDVFLTADTTLNTNLPAEVLVGLDALPGHQTLNTSPTIQVLPGGNVPFNMDVFNGSVIDVRGGHLNQGLFLEDHSTLTMSGGYIETLEPTTNSQVNLSGGYVRSMTAIGSSVSNINGGVLGHGLTADQSSIVNIRGGNFGFIKISSGTFSGIFAQDSSQVNLFGTDLKSELSDPLFFGVYSQYILSGHLLDGTDVTGLNINIFNNSVALFTITNVPAVTVSGNVALEGLSASAPAQQVAFTFRPTDGSPAFTRTVSLGANSAFNLDNVPRNHYTLHVKADKYLAVNLDLDLSVGGPVTLTLPAGDANNDNRIDLGDFGMLVNAYGSSASDPTSHYNPAADFNGDGVVNIGDFGLLVNNFGSVGAP